MHLAPYAPTLEILHYIDTAAHFTMSVSTHSRPLSVAGHFPMTSNCWRRSCQINSFSDQWVDLAVYIDILALKLTSSTPAARSSSWRCQVARAASNFTLITLLSQMCRPSVRLSNMFLVSWGQISWSWFYGFTPNERVKYRYPASKAKIWLIICNNLKTVRDRM